MLNLSDKDLDRLSQEAAQQHEPGDIVGPKFWEKLETRLDRDLGKVTPNPARGIRRLPYYYAPALLVILGVTYYLVRPGSKSHQVMSSGSPPLSITQPAPAAPAAPSDPLKPVRSSSNPVLSDNSNSTSTAPSNTLPYPGTAAVPPVAVTTTTGTTTGTGTTNAGATPGAPASPSPDRTASPRPPATARNPTSPLSSNNTSSLTSTNQPNSHPSYNPHRRRNKPIGSHPYKSTGDDAIINTTTTGTPANTAGNPTMTSGTANTTNTTATITRSPHDLTFSAVRGRVSQARVGRIDDSALRAFNLSTLRQPIHNKGGLHINRSLVLGIIGGPDYASVNSLSGDRPGSTIGVTVDYQFINHLYIGTGLLYTRKNFAAFPQDYHVPDSYWRDNGMGMGGGVEYIKGTFTMLEIPINLRWDFITSDNSLFYLGIGTSSYFFDRQNCGYYFDFYNPRNLLYKEVAYSNEPSNLFATLNFSAGAEFGLTNSLSFLVGGYVKTPTRGIGFGQVDMTSFGLTFGLHFAPVISRKR